MNEPEKTIEEMLKELATELGELTYERAVKTKQINENAQRCNEIGAAMEALK